ncbi:acetyl esterase/lipase [Sphingomonas jejuensis]|uniref:Acetyl esterase/lipase n=1 Tax=Sphingomonas jejuensis TaxID=904715 RepID=A0ABX0XQT3_9SPHN|nr:alpha/beta hydrolase [Sphingomonas jejuensis]NJC35139.1 acetyl esterase/lipase [Sphingomonas jejuensis]
MRLTLLPILLLPGCAAMTAAPTPMTWDDLAAMPQGAPDQTISYGTDEMQRIDLWRPAGPGPHPTVLMVHGGCWTTAIADRSIMNPIAADLRARGFAVWNIDYRGVDRPGGGYPGTFQDVAAAADRLRTDGPRLGLDTGRIVAVGHSAGGHLALWLAGRPRLPAGSALRTADPLPIAHVVSLGGLPDLARATAETQGCGPEPVRALISTGRADPLADISIPRLAPLGVPQTLVNGDADRIIPTDFATGYQRDMRAAGDRVAVEIVPGTGHVELVAPTTAAWARTVAAIERATGRTARP